MQNNYITVNLPANMPLKKKTIFAVTVKLLFSVTVLHAQYARDSAKQNLIHFYPLQNNIVQLKYPAVKTSLPSNFYAQRLPFFCNKELQIQKAMGIPIKFRLSSVEYCDKLEGKNRK
jgi:hypothetical protein